MVTTPNAHQITLLYQLVTYADPSLFVLIVFGSVEKRMGETNLLTRYTFGFFSSPPMSGLFIA